MINLINLLFCFWNEYLVHFRGFRKSLPITRVSAGQATGLLKIELYVQEEGPVSIVTYYMKWVIISLTDGKNYLLFWTHFFSSEIINFFISHGL